MASTPGFDPAHRCPAIIHRLKIEGIFPHLYALSFDVVAVVIHNHNELMITRTEMESALKGIKWLAMKM